MLSICQSERALSILLMGGEELMWRSRMSCLGRFATFIGDAVPVLVGTARVAWLAVYHQDGSYMPPMRVAFRGHS